MSCSNECKQCQNKDGVLKIAICGAGAIGTLYGSLLLKGGHDVTFLDAYQPMLDAALSKGQPTVTLCGGSVDEVLETLPCKLHHFKDSPEGEVYDLLILAVKASQTQETLQILKNRRDIDQNSVILTLQGAFDAPDIIHEALPDHCPFKILFGKTTCFSTGAGPLKIRNFGVGETHVWPYGTSESEEPIPRVKEVIALMNKSEFKVELAPSAIGERWKMILYYPTNIACSAIVNLSFGTVWSNPQMRTLLIEIAKEVAKIAQLEKVNLKFFNEQIAIECVTKIAQDSPQHPGSMLQDIHNKRITEIEHTAGVLVKLAQQHGIQIPFTQTINAIISCRETNYGHEVFPPN